MLEKLIEIMREVEQNDEIFELGAKINRKAYKALIFTHDDAVKIVAAQGGLVRNSG